MEVQPRQVEFLEDYEEWENSLLPPWRGIVQVRVRRVMKGLMGAYRPVGEGVCEFVIEEGPGYRLYFGQKGNRVILLIGGNKKTQKRDIKRAKLAWRAFNA